MTPLSGMMIDQGKGTAAAAAALEYDIEIFGSGKHPDFFGTIIAKDEASGQIFVANQEQYKEVQKLFDQYYNYFNPKATKAKVV
jgi:hypothetical protein